MSAMTRAEYEALSDAERDALVAERVMGWSYQTFPGGQMPHIKHWYTKTPCPNDPGDSSYSGALRSFSTTDSGACAVVRQINEQPGYAMMLFYAHQSNANSVLVWDLGAAPFGAGAVFHHVSEYLKTEPEIHASLREKFGQQCFDAVVESGPDMPAIICLAALRAVGAVE